MTLTERLRELLDEHGIEHEDEYIKSAMPYCEGYEGTYWNDDSFGYVEPIRPKPNTLGSHPELTIHNCTPEQAIEATLGREDTFTREDVESSFVRGYSLGSLPVGSGPRWDQNRQTVEEHMAELGWERSRGTCRIKERRGEWHCSGCGEVVGTCDPTSEPCIDGNAIELWNYCPSCGRKLADE